MLGREAVVELDTNVGHAFLCVRNGRLNQPSPGDSQHALTAPGHADVPGPIQRDGTPIALRQQIRWRLNRKRLAPR